MVSDVKITSNIKEFTRGLNEIQSKQIPFATMRAINDTAFAVMRENKKQLSNYIDEPTPFTKSGVMVEKAKKTNLDAVVYFAKDRADYMQLQITGGVRRPSKKVILVAQQAARLNKYGNISQANRQKMFTNKAKYFTTDRGIYERFGPGKRQSKLVARFAKQARYKPLYPFKDLSRREANRVFDGYFLKALAFALKTAK